MSCASLYLLLIRWITCIENLVLDFESTHVSWRQHKCGTPWAFYVMLSLTIPRPLSWNHSLHARSRPKLCEWKKNDLNVKKKNLNVEKKNETKKNYLNVKKVKKILIWKNKDLNYENKSKWKLKFESLFKIISKLNQNYI